MTMPDTDTIIQPGDSRHFMIYERELCDLFDECAMKAEADTNSILKKLRQNHPTLAKAIETGLSHARSRAQSGIGSSAYLKETCIQRCFGEYAGSEE